MFSINKNYLFTSLFAVFSIFSANILAQDDADENVEEVIVTGSRIATVDLDGINPVQIITSEDIKDSGVLVVVDAIRNSMANTFGSEPEGFGGSVDTSVSLRGLGAQRTLVLVDGKRLAGSPAQAGAVPNLNIIPTAAVERVEILTDGASSVYGGSAAGGVVNVILKDDFEGVNIRGGMTENHLPGGEENNFSIVLGSSGAKSNVVMTYEHQERDAKYWADRPYTGSTGNGQPAARGGRRFNLSLWASLGRWLLRHRPAGVRQQAHQSAEGDASLSAATRFPSERPPCLKGGPRRSERGQCCRRRTLEVPLWPTTGPNSD